MNNWFTDKKIRNFSPKEDDLKPEEALLKVSSILSHDGSEWLRSTARTLVCTSDRSLVLSVTPPFPCW
jgi:hypothetical protein